MAFVYKDLMVPVLPLKRILGASQDATTDAFPEDTLTDVVGGACPQDTITTIEADACPEDTLTAVGGACPESTVTTGAYPECGEATAGTSPEQAQTSGLFALRQQLRTTLSQLSA
jgi:hypothetical protein